MVSIADESRALAEDILSSAQGRQGAIADLKSWVTAFLTRSRAERLEAFRTTRQRLDGRVLGLAAETQDFLAQCDEEQCAVAKSLRRAADEQRSRASDGETTRLETFLQIRDFHDQIRDQITRNVAALGAETRRFLRDCDARQGAVKDEVRHAARELRQQLLSGADARRAAFGELHDRVAGRVSGLARKVRGQLAESRQDFRTARGIWQRLAFARFRGPGARPSA